MPATTTRVSSAVRRMLDAGQVSSVDAATGVLRTLHANCPDDGQRASVRRVSREHGGPIMELTMRCPVCFRDFAAQPESLYISGRTSKAPSAAKTPAKAATKAGTKTAAKGAAKSGTKTAAKTAAKPAAKSGTKTVAKTATKSGTKTPAKSATKSTKRASKGAKTAPRTGGRTGQR